MGQSSRGADTISGDAELRSQRTPQAVVITQKRCSAILLTLTSSDSRRQYRPAADSTILYNLKLQQHPLLPALPSAVSATSTSPPIIKDKGMQVF
jgi:hypothetical protein